MPVTTLMPELPHETEVSAATLWLACAVLWAGFFAALLLSL